MCNAWHGLPEVAASSQEHRQLCQHCHGAVAHSLWHAARMRQAEGRCSAALPEVASVPRLPRGSPSRPRGVPYPTKHRGLKNIPTACPSVLHQLELGPGVNPETRLRDISSAPSPTGTVEPPPTWAMVSQPSKLLLQWEAKPEPQKLCRGPQGEVRWGPTQQDTLGCCDTPGLRP